LSIEGAEVRKTIVVTPTLIDIQLQKLPIFHDQLHLDGVCLSGWVQDDVLKDSADIHIIPGSYELALANLLARLLGVESGFVLFRGEQHLLVCYLFTRGEELVAFVLVVRVADKQGVVFLCAQLECLNLLHLLQKCQGRHSNDDNNLIILIKQSSLGRDDR